MANENQQHVASQTEAVQQPLATVEAEALRNLGVRGASRRRFARAGAGATGVLMTLASQPGMACSVCRAPSGYQSVKANPNAAISNKVNRNLTCAGWPPKTWYANCSSAWQDVPFKNVFTCNNTTNNVGNATAKQLLSLWNATTTTSNPAVTVNEYSILAMWLVAAYLNVLYKKSEFLTKEHLTGIWNEYQLKKCYTPTAGATAWTHADIIVYLSGTMD